jgi:hypothetical protein
MILLFTLPAITGITGMYHHAYLFLLRWGSGTSVLFISSSLITGMIGMYHSIQLLAEMRSQELFA